MNEEDILNLFGGMAMLTGAFVLIMLLVSLAFAIFFLVTEWKLYKKMGEPGWKVLIPVYNQYILFKRVWNTKMFVIYILLAFVPGLLVFITALIGIGLTLIDGDDSVAAPIILTMGNIIMPVASIGQTIINIILSIYTAKAFGKDGAYSIGLIFLPIVFRTMLAFGKAQYVGNMSGKNQNVNYQANNNNPQGYCPTGYGNNTQGYAQPNYNQQGYNPQNLGQLNYNQQNYNPQNYNQNNQNNQNGNNYPPQY